MIEETARRAAPLAVALFAFILTRIDAQGDIARGVALAVRDLHAAGDPGSAVFIMLSERLRLWIFGSAAACAVMPN